MKGRVCEAAIALFLALFGAHVLTGPLHAAPTYPVTVGPTGRYLVDQSGTPFLIVGESPQAMIGNLSLADAELFFANRRSHGFNTVWINLLCASYTGCNSDGSTFDGIAPFTVPGDLSTPNEAYFARADAILALAARYGFLVILDPAETGSWLGVMRSNGVDKCRAYGQFLGKRYARVDNIVWMHGNDYDYDDYDGASDNYTIAVALGIRDFDTRHLHTVEFYFPVSSSTDDPRWAPIIGLNAAYSYDPVYVEILEDYNRPNALPVFLVEAGYELENYAVLGAAPRNLRAQEYWAMLSGATGQMFGNHYTWQFIDGWKDNLDSPGAVQMEYLTALFRSRPWYDLVPDQGHTVVTSGIGAFGSGDYVSAARTPDGRLVMAYVPSARTITVDMSALSGPAIARWYDPAAGTYVAIASSALVNSGSRVFTTPGPNADGPGNEDWVLVIEVVSSFLELTVTADTYAVGEQIAVLLTAFNAGGSVRDVYVGVLLPDGRTLAYFTASNVVGGTTSAALPSNLRPFASLAPGELLVLAVSNPVVAGLIPQGTPSGQYTWFSTLVTPGAFSSGTPEPSDIEAIAIRSVVILP